LKKNLGGIPGVFLSPFFCADVSSHSFSPVVVGAILLSVIVATATALALTRTARSKKELLLKTLEKKKLTDNPSLTDAIREKLQRLPVSTVHHKSTVQAISKIVEEETESRLKEVQQEYSVKYQVMVQEKNKEVDGVRRQYTNALEKYDHAQREYKRVDTEKKNTEAVVKSIAEGLVVVNQKGEVLLMNPAAEKLLGIPSERKIGKSITDNVGSEYMVSLAREVEGTGEKVVEYTSRDENIKKTIRQSSAVIQDEDGRTVGMVNILTDITKQRELDEIKNRFVSNVTHELRTPIVAIQKAVEILVDKKGPPLTTVQQNFLGIIQRNLQHLNRLVEDLLDVARIESGKLRLKFIPARLDKLMINACDSLVTWAKSKDITLERDIDKSLPEIPMDSVRITQVLNNLIGNAIKFTPSGGKIIVSSGWNDENSLKITVADNGVGIAVENLPKLFGRFEQFGDQQGISGTGLGLCISKEIVERHNGKIWVDSQEKKGSKFMFFLPLRQQAPIGGS
jgi:PAS domain S-box-containing protein